jgi:hypothetical protein
MTLLNPALLGGLLLAVIPVILHFLFKQKPKPLVFPALRLVQQRRTQNLRRIRLRHIWLLLLRTLAIALLVFALLRPSLPAANYSFTFGEWILTFAIVIAGIVGYVTLVRMWRRSPLPLHEFKLRRTRARGYTTGATLLTLLLLVGCPYQYRVAAEIKAPPQDRPLDLPVAAVFLFDTSLSMTYQQEGQTRLERAFDIAKSHISELPSGSRVSIVDTARDDVVVFQQTLSGAQSRLESLTPAAVNLPLNDRLRTCLLAQEEDRKRTLAEQGAVAEDARQDRYLRRVCVLTDLTQAAWRRGSSTVLPKEIERLRSINVFLVDVGDAEPRNLAVRQIRLSRQQVPEGGVLAVSALVDSTGLPAGDVTLSLNRLRGDDERTLQSREAIKLEAGGSQWVRFPLLKELSGPVWHGEVRIEASDPLAMDDARGLTAVVGAPPRVLVVAPRKATAESWMIALAPLYVNFQTEFLAAGRLREADLATYDVVYLINVSGFSDAEWSQLAKFVEQGGGLGVIVGGDGVQPASYNRAQAQAFLPARLNAIRLREDRRLSIDNPDHPVFAKLQEDGGVPILEGDVLIDRYFVTEPGPGCGVLATVTDEDRTPLLIERSTGEGRTLLMTTAVDPADGPFSRWNNLADPNQIGWPFLAYAEASTLYLARSTENVFNLTAGEELHLAVEPLEVPRTFKLRRPEFKQSRVAIAAGENRLVASDIRDIGRYEIIPSEGGTTALYGFSVNVAGDESDLRRLETPQLDELLGAGQYQVARTIDELKAGVTAIDLGKEVLPILLVLVIVAFLGEHFVANWFYEIDEEAAGTNAAATLRGPASHRAPRGDGRPDGVPPPSATPSPTARRETGPVPS